MSQTVRTLITLVALLWANNLVLAQADRTKALIGTWEGQVEANVTGGNQRTLVINSVKAAGEGEWVARGRYGISGQIKEGPGGQEMSVTSKDNEIFVEFSSGNAKSPVRLKLVSDNKLEGTVGVMDRGRMSDRKISMEKVATKAEEAK